MVPSGGSGILTSGPYTKDNKTCAGFAAGDDGFTEANCDANNAAYGKTYYKIFDKTNKKCALTSMCKSTVKNDNFSIQNVYRNPKSLMTVLEDELFIYLCSSYFEL